MHHRNINTRVEEPSEELNHNWDTQHIKLDIKLKKQSLMRCKTG